MSLLTFTYSESEHFDDLQYTNFSITESGIGFNLKIHKPINSQITSESILEKYTYNRYKSHIKKLKVYISKLEQIEQYGNPYKVNTKKAYEEFGKI